jgi:diguanylate cyclase (GGDEF)-like protein
MISLVVSRLAKLTLPLVIFATCIFIAKESSGFNASWLNAATTGIPFMMLSVAILLSLKFNHSRYIILTLLTGIIYAFSQGYIPILNRDYVLAGYALIAINLFALSFCRDRSLFSIHGFYKFMALVLQLALGWAFILYYPALFAQFIFADFLNLPFAYQSQFGNPDFLLLTFFSVLLGHAFTSVKTNGSIQATFFGCQLASLLILSEISIPNMDPLVAASGFLLIIISIVMNSYEMAYMDDLTKLPSRRYLNQSLMSLGNTFVIAMLDIDHFKKFNDTHGHHIGDEVLRMVAMKIAAVTGGGKPFRYGGEEFTVVFPGKSMDEVEFHLDALRHSIEKYTMVVRGNKRPTKSNKSAKKGRVARNRNSPTNQKLSVTISIGYASRSDNYGTPEQVIKAADEALYRAKGNGRNCISI